MGGNTLVPDKLHGYTLQVRHMMHELISLDLERVVSIEALDDVAVESNDVVIAGQIKSVQSDNNPVANRSAVFWKTLYNWFQYVKNGDIPLKKAIFQFIAVANRRIESGAIPESFAEASNIEMAKAALLKAKDVIWGMENELKSQVPDSYSEYLEVLFDPINEGIVEQIIQSMQIHIYIKDYDIKLFENFCSQTIPPEYAEELFIYMLGWIHEQVNAETKKGKPAYILCKSFRDTLQAQIRGRDLNKAFSWIAVQPSEKETRSELERHDTYIKQLVFIELDDSLKLQAASDFLRTSAEKTIWAERGIVTSQSFTEYHDRLARMWGNQFQLVSLTPAQSIAENGKRLYFICQEAVQSIKVQGNDTPEFFGAGSLHALANEPPEEPRIGWHPTYKELLKSGGDFDG
ncbi:MAG: ABC-three component system protein [Syntrophomonas sp.]